MSQGLVNVCNAENVQHHPVDCDLREAHVVVLDDGDTYSGVPGARVYLDGKGYDIGDLLDFYLASMYVANACPVCGLEIGTCGCGAGK